MNGEITDKELSEIGVVKRRRLIRFMRLCVQHNLDYRKYGIDNMGRNNLRKLSMKLFPSARRKDSDTGYSIGERMLETKQKRSRL